MAEETTTTRKCATCGQMQPPSEFDARFLNKPVRLTCAACRREKAEHEAELHRIWLERSGLGEEIRRQRQEELLREERRQERERVMHALEAAGFTEEERSLISYVAPSLRRRTWDEVRQLYLTLDPPYLRLHERRGRGMPKPPARERIFAEQQGRCYLCGHELLALAVWAERAGGSFVSTMSRSMKQFARTSIPVLDHKMPIARGGTNALENLAYACAECNQRKYIRTEAEFRAMPNDPITRIRLAADTMESLLSYEARCDPQVWAEALQVLRWRVY